MCSSDLFPSHDTQEHDALVFMYKEEEEDEIIPRLMEDMIYPVKLRGDRIMRIPSDVVVGWNKGKWHEEDNPNGLKVYKGHDSRKRIKEDGLLDRLISRRTKS